MTTQITFREHDSFHAEVLRGTLGAAAGGTLAGLLITLGFLGGSAQGSFFPAIALAVLGFGFAIGYRGERRRQRLLRAGLSGLAAVVPTLLLVFLTSSYMWFALLLAGVGLGLAATLFEPGPTRVVGGLLGIPALLLGGFAALRFGAFGLAEGWAPVPIITTLAGAVGGFVAVTIGGLRRLAFLRDPVARAFRKAEDALRGELLRHATQAKRVYDQILEDLAKRKVDRVLEHEIMDRSKELCLSLLETAMRWQAIQGETAHKNEADMRARIDDLMGSAAQATDAVAREQYERAARSLEEQRAYLQSIGRGRERTVARIVAQLALLEKVRFSLVNFHVTDNERLADELKSVSRELEELTSDVDIIGQAIREGSALPPATAKETVPEAVPEAIGATAEAATEAETGPPSAGDTPAEAAEAAEADAPAEALASSRVDSAQ